MRIAPWIWALAAASALATPAAAQTRLRPGLWEFTTQMKSQSGELEKAQAEMQKALAEMPAAQRKQMEQMMAQRGVGVAADGGRTIRICMSREQVERDEVPQQEGCTHRTQRQGANTIKTTFSCPARNGSGASSGEGTVTIDSPTAFQAKNVVRTVENQRSEQMEMTQKGRWLSDDCGPLKPLAPPPKR